MRTTITLKTGVVYSFFMPDGGGYVRLEGKNSEGTLGQQICNKGFSGGTISATPETFVSKCKSWVKKIDR